MTARLRERVQVATCIACGARSRVGDCPDGCVDVPLDLVEAVEVDALAARVEALERRTEALRSAVAALERPSAAEWGELRAEARAALALPVPEAAPDPLLVQAWGCPDCGRVDAPQPCLDVCIRRPVLMADASEYELVAARAAALAEDERRLSALAWLVAHLTPRAGQEERTRAELRHRAAAALGDRR